MNLWNMISGMLIRDGIRADIKLAAMERAKKDRGKALEKQQKAKEKHVKEVQEHIEKEKYLQGILEDENKWREDFDKKAREGKLQHEKDYQERLYNASHLELEGVEKCEIKEGVKADIDGMEYPEKKLKYNDDGKIYLNTNNLTFSGTVKEIILKKSDIKSHEIYKNGILIVKNKGKNIFFKIDSKLYDTNKFGDLISGVTKYVDKDEGDIEIMNKLVEYFEKNGTNGKLDLLDMADYTNTDVINCARILKDLEEKGVITLTSDEGKKTKTIEEIRNERSDDLTPTYIKIRRIVLKVFKWIGITILVLFGLVIILSLIASIISKS